MSLRIIMDLENKNMKFIMGIVLYNPDEENLLRIINLSREELFDKILVYDNSEESHKSSLEENNIVYITNLTNDGLARPYNQMIEISLQERADFLCILDQDSKYSSDEIGKMIRFLNTDYNRIEDSVIIAPRTYQMGVTHVQRGDYLTPVDYAINSGSFLQLHLIKSLNLRYDENVFLDGVDYEFGWQIKKKGYKTSVYEDSVFVQNLGYRLNDYDRFAHHSAFRYYLIAKNRRYIYRKHKGVLKGTLLATLKNIYLCGRILKHEDCKKDKLISCIRGMTCRR